MDNYSIYEVSRSSSNAEVSYTVKGRNIMPFKTDRTNVIIYLENKNEFRLFNRFSGRRVRNYHSPAKSYSFKPNSKEKALLMRHLSIKDVSSLAFLDGDKSELEQDFPDIIEDSIKQHKIQFSHG